MTKNKDAKVQSLKTVRDFVRKIPGLSREQTLKACEVVVEAVGQSQSHASQIRYDAGFEVFEVANKLEQLADSIDQGATVTATQLRDMAARIKRDEFLPSSSGVLKRTNLLTQVIDDARRKVGSSDASSIFNELKRMAGGKVTPLVGVTESGIKWESASGKMKEFTLDALRKRLKKLAGSSAD